MEIVSATLGGRDSLAREIFLNHYTLAPANYSDYRDFLKVRFEEMKTSRPSFSLSSLAKKGCVSKSLLQFVFKKLRHLSLDRIPPLARALKLSPAEEHYVYLMVGFNSSRNPTIRMHFEEILNRLRHESVSVNEVESARSETNDRSLYSDYLKMIIQALARVQVFEPHVEWIKAHLMFEVSPIEISRCLEELIKDGFLYQDGNGKVVAKPESLWRPNAYDPTGQLVYKKGAEGIAKLMSTPQKYRPSVYSTMSLSLDETQLLRAEKLMIEVHHKLCALSEESRDPTAVAHIGNFLLTVARLQKF